MLQEFGLSSLAAGGETVWKGLNELQVGLVDNIEFPGGTLDALDSQFTRELQDRFGQPCAGFGVEIGVFERPTRDVLHLRCKAIEHSWQLTRQAHRPRFDHEATVLVGHSSQLQPNCSTCCPRASR